MKLNLGCGHKKLYGWVNVDILPPADQLWNLENLPWPWEDNSVESVRMIHVLEHLGESKDAYLGIIKELYRVCKPNADIFIVVPHPRHDDFLNDPTHVRPITPESLLLFSKEENEKNIAAGYSNTPLALQLGVDFQLVKVTLRAAEDFQEKHHLYNNTIKQIEIELRVIK